MPWIVSLAILGWHTLFPAAALSMASPGWITGWGNNTWGTLDFPPALSNQVMAVAAAQYHSMALLADGSVLAWGGDGTDYQEVNAVPPGLNNVVAIAAGQAVSLALKSDGRVVAWGPNFSGQTNVPAGANDVVAIAAGGYHALAVQANGSVRAWGQNDSGQIDVPEGLPSVRAVAGGGWHSLALKRDGTVAAWGYNGYGQTNVPPGLSNVVAIAAGENHSLALQGDGSVVAWGWNAFNQTNVPVDLDNVVAISASGFHNLALRHDGTVRAWGRNDSGQCDVPADRTNLAAVAAGGYHNLAVVPSPNERTLVAAGSEWHYRDTGTAPGATWHAPGFNDSAWPAGPAQLGYGDGDEATVVSFGPDQNHKYITTYFRRSFAVDPADTYTNLTLRLVRDDGAVVYLNGTEVFRSNMPAGTVTDSTLAASGLATAVENLWQPASIDPNLLVNGLNVLAVEVHQVNLTSSDLSFDLELTGAVESTGQIPLETALDTSGLTWTTSQSWPWFGQPGITHDGVDAAQSKRAVCDETSWLRTTVEGPGTVSFWWKADIHGPQYFLSFFVVGGTGVWPQAISVNEPTDWRWETCVFGAGSQTLAWMATANCDAPDEYAQGWLDQVVITGPGRESAPFFTTQPANHTVPAGVNVSLQAVVAGYPFPSLQWQHDGIDLPGQTNAVLVLGSVHPSDAGHYCLTASNPLGSVCSQSASLAVLPDQPGCAGSLDPSFDAGRGIWPDLAPQAISAMTVQPDGKVIIAGAFVEVQGTEVEGIARLNADGSLDTNYVAHPDDVTPHSRAVQPDGKVLMITEGSPPQLVRYHANQTLDAGFVSALPAGYWPRAIALQPDGRIVVAGGIPADMNTPPFYVNQAALRLMPNGALDPSFNPDLHASLLPGEWTAGETVAVYDVLLAPDGRLYLGGFFTAVNGMPRSVVARLLADGTLDPSFTPDVDVHTGHDPGIVETVTAMALTPDGKLMIAGFLERINGLRRNAIARLLTTSEGCAGIVILSESLHYVRETNAVLDISITRTASTNTAATVAFVTSDSSAYWKPYWPYWPATAGEDYTALQTTVTFAPGETTQTITIPILDDALLESSEEFYLELAYATNAPNAALLRSGLIRTTATIWDDESIGVTGSVDESFAQTGLDGPVLSVACDAGHILVAGSFTHAAGQARSGLARLSLEGQLDAAFHPEINGSVAVVGVDPVTHKILVAGSFTNVNGIPCGSVARLHPDGSTDPTFAADVEGAVSRLKLLPNGQMLVSGSFSIVDGLIRNNVARLNANGSLDPTFDIGTGIWLGTSRRIPYDIVPQPDGKVIVCGWFDNINGVAGKAFARLHATGAVDPAFAPTIFQSGDYGTTAVVLPDGRILASGWIRYGIGGLYHVGIVRLHADGVLDTSFHVTNRSQAGTIVLQPDGKILYGGDIRLHPDGTEDPSYFSGTGFRNADASATALLPDGDLIVGGNFTSANGYPYARLVRLNGDLITPLHPADLQPGDGSLTIAEVTGYGAAWRQGQLWPLPPNLIPIDYVTRAAALWQEGECYQLEPNIHAPLCWVSCPPTGPGAAPVVRGSAAAPAPSAAIRLLPPVFIPGEPLAVSVTTAPADVLGWAVEEQIPSGWSISQVSHAGEFDAEAGKVKWGPFVDGTSRTLTYHAIPPVDAAGSVTVSGAVSFDGASAAITGPNQSAATSRLLGLTYLGAGRFSLQVQGDTGERVSLEVSSDLETWESLGVMAVGNNQIEFDDPQAAGLPQRFYRISREQ